MCFSGSENSSKNGENRPDLGMTYCRFPEPLSLFKTACSMQVLSISKGLWDLKAFLEMNAF